MADKPIIFCDTVQSMAVHNGIVRIALIRLDSDGKPVPALDLLLPVNQVSSLTKALQGAAK